MKEENKYNFSLLMSLYIKEDPQYLERALLSIFEQSLQADEIILVEDGALTDELYAVLEKWEKKLPIKRIPLKNNVGLGQALNIGIQHCSNDFIARMDTDDIALRERFKKQIDFFKQNPKVDIIGTAISEFYDDENKIESKRILPQSHEELIKWAKSRNPFNHMTVMFKKDTVVNAGNYQSCNGFEDYYLWVRIFFNGGIGGNLKEILVNARTGKNMLKRRHGFKYMIDEFKFWKMVHKTGFISFQNMIFKIFIRCPLRIMPYFILKFIYRKLLRT